MASIVKRGPGQYLVRIRIKRFPPKAQTFRTLPEAKEWAKTTEAELHLSRTAPGILRDAHGAIPQTSSSTPTGATGLTLKLALERYAREVTPHKKGALQERLLIRRWQDNKLAGKPLEAVRGTDLAQHRDKRLAEGKSGNTVRLELAVISHLYEIARKEWGFEGLANPVKDIRKPKLPKGRDRRLEAGELDKLLGYCDKRIEELKATKKPEKALAPFARTRIPEEHSYVALKAAIRLATETAMRRSELCGLRWSDVDLTERPAVLTDTKNGDQRVVPLSTVAKEAIESLPKRSERVLALEADWLSHLFHEACDATGIEGLRLHDLRHEATSKLFEKGLNTMEVASVTGHKTLQMLKRYTHLRAKDLLGKIG